LNNQKIIIIGNGSIAKNYKNILKKKFYNFKVFLIPSRKFLINNKINTLYKSLLSRNLFKLAIICSPANMHINHSIFFAKKKIDLLIEKPLSSGISKKVFLLKKIINKNKILCHVGYMFKFSSAAQELKKIILKKKLGKLKYANIVCESFLPNWRKKNYKHSVSAQKKLGGGVINELSHEIHLCRWFFGIPKKVSSYNFNSGLLKIDCEDNSVSNLKYLNSFQLFMNLSFSRKINKRYVHIFGTNGDAKWDIIKNDITINNKDKTKTKIKKFKIENLYLKQLNYIINMNRN
jgi:predicted dehydrogenase